MSQKTVGDLIARLPRYGARPALGLRQTFAARWWSYRQLHEAVCCAASRMQFWGIPTHARILIWASNSPEWVATLLAGLARGCIVVPVDADSSPEQVQKLADAVQATALFFGADQDPASISIPAYSIVDASARDGSAPQPPVKQPIAPDQPALIMYTSGATSEPKGVILTHQNLAAQLAVFSRWRWLLHLLPCRLLCLSPLSHVQGLVVGALIPLSIGLSVLYSNALDPAHIMRTIRQNRITVLLAVPRVQHLLAEALRQLPGGRGSTTLAERASKIRFFPLRRHILFTATHAHLGYSFWILMVGGATLPPADERFWYECGYVLVQGYGLTETTALASVRINSPFFTRLGSIGKPLAHGELRLTEEGEILIRGAAVSPGYFGESGATPGAGNGFLHTGDLAALDQQRLLYFRGRKTAIVTGEGHNVYPADVETVLRRQEGVRDAAVVPLEKKGLAEVHAVLLLERDALAADIVAEANSLLQPYQRIRSWTVWPEADFPRTNLHKIRREVVAHQVAAFNQAGRPLTETSPSRLGLREIRQIEERGRRLEALARYLCLAGVSEPGEEEVLLVEDLGLSSLDLVELVALVEREETAAPLQFSVPRDMSLSGLRASVHERRAIEAGRPLPSRQPRWSGSAAGRLLRRISQPLLIGLWARLSARVTVRWETGGGAGQGPWLFAAAPHHNWIDAFAIYAALPRVWRRGLVTVTNRNFSEFFAPTPAVDPKTKKEIGLAYYLLWPLVFEFAIVPEYGSTRQGLHDLGRFIERGYSPISFPKGLTPPGAPNPQHAPGMAAIALESGLPVLPIWLRGNEHLQTRPALRPPEVTVWIGKPVQPDPRLAPSQLVEQVERAFGRLAALAEHRSR